MEEGILITEAVVAEDSTRDLASKRLKICESCPLFIKSTKVCNPSRWMHPKTRDVSRRPKSGYIRGCGCALSHKTANPNNHCTLKFW